MLPLINEDVMVMLIVDALAFDLAYMDYGFSENIFRAAYSKFKLYQDPDVQECV